MITLEGMLAALALLGAIAAGFWVFNRLDSPEPDIEENTTDDISDNTEEIFKEPEEDLPDDEIKAASNLSTLYVTPFCSDCMLLTTDDSPGSVSSFNLIGTTLFGKFDKCPKCGSVVSHKVGVFFGIPIKFHGDFRVIYLSETDTLLGSRSTYVGRKIKSPKTEMTIW